MARVYIQLTNWAFTRTSVEAWASLYINTSNILESTRIGPRRGLNPQPQDPGAPSLPTLLSVSVV